MKLHLTATSERGKPVTKSGNEYLYFEIRNDKRSVIARVAILATDKENVFEFDCSLGYGFNKTADGISRVLELRKPKTAREIPIVLQAKVDAFNAGFGSKKHRAIFCEDAGEFVEQEWTGTEWLCLHN